MEELENPFLENNETLVCLDTKDIAENIVCDTEKLDRVGGKTKISGILHEKATWKTKSMDDTLQKNKLPLFSYKPPLQAKHSSDISTLKENMKLFPNYM